MADPPTDLSKRAKQHWANEQWGEYRNTRYEMAEHARQSRDWERALRLYVEVLLFDLQGVSGCGEDGFSSAHQREAPSAARELARLFLHQRLDGEALKSVFGRVTDEFWVGAFPRSRNDVWDDLQSVVREYVNGLRLRNRVESLGPNRLLPANEADAYAERADDYELLRRIGMLLENESPTRIPEDKRRRTHDYLSAVDIEQIGDRWKAKAYQWAGEVVLSNNEPESALNYFEQALDLADLDDRATVKRRVKQLRDGAVHAS
jgi:tetratricopeptide (TPR) repeat protein